MAIEKILNTRIQLKYDSLENWSSKNPTLKSGELAIAYLPPKGNGVAPAATSDAVLFKVGPGEFNSLPWASALAADVYSWAKKSEAEFTTWVKGLIDIGDIDLSNYYNKTQVDNLVANKSTNDRNYADGVAATAKSEAIAAAADDATTKANTAETNAKAHATDLDEAMGVRVKALEDHTDDYKAYADQAETDAISTAAGDATSKANKALADAKDYAEAQVKALKEGDVAANATAIATEKGRAEGEEARIEGLLEAYKTSNNSALAEVKATAEAARTEEEVNGQIDTKIAALNLATTYEPIGAESRAKAYVDQKIGDADLSQYTTEQEVKDIVDTVIADAVDGDTITGLTNLVEYLHTHGGEAAEMGAAIDVLEGKVETIEGKPAYGITASQISNWDGEVGAKALAGTKLDAATFTSYETAHVNDYTNKQIDDAIDADVAKAIEDEVARANGAYDAKGAAATAKSEAIADAAGKYETIGTAQGIVDGLKLGETYEPIGAETRAIAAAKTETENQVSALTNGQVKTNKEAIEAINNTSTGILKQAKDYADGLAGNYATAAQGAKADSALQKIETTANNGLVVTNNNKIDIDTNVVFVFNCGDASTLVD